MGWRSCAREGLHTPRLLQREASLTGREWRQAPGPQLFCPVTRGPALLPPLSRLPVARRPRPPGTVLRLPPRLLTHELSPAAATPCWMRYQRLSSSPWDLPSPPLVHWLALLPTLPLPGGGHSCHWLCLSSPRHPRQGLPAQAVPREALGLRSLRAGALGQVRMPVRGTVAIALCAGCWVPKGWGRSLLLNRLQSEVSPVAPTCLCGSRGTHMSPPTGSLFLYSQKCPLFY